MVSDLPDYITAVNVTVSFPSTEIGRPKVYDSTVASAGTKKTLDINTDLGRNGGDGYIKNKGDGLLYVYISDDGTNYNGGKTAGSNEKIILADKEKLRLGGLNIDTIQLDSDEDGTAYKVVVV